MNIRPAVRPRAAWIKSGGVALSAVVASMLLVSCAATDTGGDNGGGGGEDADLTANVLERSADAANAEWELAIDPLGQPAVADGVALFYANDNGLNAHAVSVVDGKELWSQPINPGIGAPGVLMSPALTTSSAGDDVALFLQLSEVPEEDLGYTWWTSPVAVDLKSGEELYRGEAQLVSSRPAACDDGKDMCFTTHDPVESITVAHRVDLATGTVLNGAEVNPLSGSFRSVGAGGLYSVVENGTESLARVSAGKEMWTVSISSLFGPGSTTNLGWTFEHSEEMDLYVGSVGLNPTPEIPYRTLIDEGYTSDLTQQKLVAFRASTGEALWSVTGAASWCSYRTGKAATLFGDGDALPLRCEYTQGTQDSTTGDFENAEAKIAGYDPLTGEAKWETEAMPISEIEDLLVPTLGRGDSVIAGSAEGLVLLDTESGASRPTTAEDVFLCSEYATYPAPAGSPYLSWPQGDKGSGGVIAFPCDKDGNNVPTLTIGALNDVSAVDGGVAVVAVEGRIAGYKIP